MVEGAQGLHGQKAKRKSGDGGERADTSAKNTMTRTRVDMAERNVGRNWLLEWIVAVACSKL